MELGKNNILKTDLTFSNATFSLFTDKLVKIDILKYFLTASVYSAFQESISDKKRVPKWYCKTCNKMLEGTVICCDRCISWIHIKCTNLSKEPKKNEDWFCTECKA